MNCRHCAALLQQTFLDLGFAPPSNAYLRAGQLGEAERYFPLKLRVCTDCWLVQTEDYAAAGELFSADYAYFSSTSSSWCTHAQRYAAAVTERLALDGNSLVIEVAANDGYLLKHFIAAGIPSLGIEPTASTAAAAERLGIAIIREFFGEALGQRLAGDGQQADLIVGNNVFAHVPDINDFSRGLKAALKPTGTLTLEFPHLLQLIEQVQFDTVYHEHFSYLSLYSVQRILAAAGLSLYDVEVLATHGGSLRVYATHAERAVAASAAVTEVLRQEEQGGLRDLTTYLAFQARADGVKNDFLAFLLEQKKAGRRVAAYGAAAKGNTLLNYAGVKPDLLAYVCDAAPSKQGQFLPGSHIPVLAPGHLHSDRPDVLVLLPWNLAEELLQQLAFIRDWGGRFATAVPTLKVF